MTLDEADKIGTRLAIRQSLTRVRAKVAARVGAASDGDVRRSREDLVQLEFAYLARKLDAQERSDLGDRERLTEAHLEVPWSSIAIASSTVSAPHIQPALRLIADQLAEHDETEFSGAKPDTPPKWIRFDLGGKVELVPAWACVYWEAGTISSVPLVLETWEKSGGQELQVLSRAQDHQEATRYLNGLINDSRGTLSPYRGRLLKASWGRGGVNLDILPDPTDTRDRLVLPDSLWEALDVNVHRMFARMPAFDRAGLGGNRGILLAGPPGTGKTAACRVLAQEVVGDATAIFVDSRVGEGLLPQMYAEISGLGPALVLLEDLDMIVGAREDHSQRGPLLDFLTVLDGLMTQHHHVVTVATTNDAAAVDVGVRRAARFDRIVTFPIPDEITRRRILEVYLEAVQHTVDTERVAGATEGATGAELREYVRGALLAASDVVTTDHVLDVVAHGSGAPRPHAAVIKGKYL
jgi:cell division protease FtsH